MLSNNAIELDNISKIYEIYSRPGDRLKQFFLSIFNLFSKANSQTKVYTEFTAIKNISFSVKKGETIGIIGKNGGGKSTLLQIICGVLNPSAGSAKVNGRISALLELGSGFNPSFTGRENIFLNAAILGLSKKEIELKYDEICRFADIGDFIDRPIKTYSSGMVVRLAFAVAINVDPEILVIDEALAVGDELFQRKCFAKINQIKRCGTTILFVSHSGELIIDLCDRAVLLNAGRLISIGNPKTIVELYRKLLYATPNADDALLIDSEKSDVSHSIDGEGSHSVEYFDPSLVPQSTMHYESRGAKISKPKITTLDGTQVNNLLSGSRYIYSYIVNFFEDSDYVRFGMLIKSITGLELGGAVSSLASSNGLRRVLAESILEVQFEFSCNLNSGLYFFNAGVLGSPRDEEIFLHRVLDICAFRVLPNVDSIGTVTVNFNCQNRIIFN